MLKKIVLAILTSALVFTLSGCGQPVEDASESGNTSMFTVIEKTRYWSVVYQNETKVMYAVSFCDYNRGNFTLLVNADGTPMTYDGGE